MILNNIKNIPVCLTCGKDFNVNIINNTKGFNSFCSAVCAGKNKVVREKTKQTNIKKYGVENPSSNKIVRDKVKTTCLEKYGIDNIMKNPDTVEKIKQTKLEKYGDSNWNNKNKSKETCIKKYGVEHSTQSEMMKHKTRKTCLEKYGTTNGGWCEDARKKIIESNIKNLNVEFPMQNDEVKEKAKKTFIKKYGVSSPFQLNKTIYTNKLRVKTESYNKFIKNNEFDEPVFSLEDYLNRDYNKQQLKFKCKKCGNIFEAAHYDGHHSKCPVCYPVSNGISDTEKEILNFLKTNLNYDILENVRDVISPYELDIYIPEKNIAVEFDGLYWHSIAYKPKKYHLMKTELCEKNGIQLIHIFENEWIYNRKIVESRLLNLIGPADTTIFARMCKIKNLSNNEAKMFFDENHIQGYVNSSVNLGLFLNKKLVAAMSFSKNRFSNKYEYEMTRFCSLLNHRIIGGAGKLLKYFEKNFKPRSLVSYADRRWSTGKLYKLLNFKFIKNSEPNYWYIRKNSLKLESRIKYQKHKLKNILKNFDSKKTEIQNMLDNGFNIIYDCGNKVYIKDYEYAT